MRISSFNYLVKDGIKNLWLNRIMAVTSVGVLTTCLIILSAAYLMTMNVESMVSFVEGQSEMSVFLEDVVVKQSTTLEPDLLVETGGLLIETNLEEIEETEENNETSMTTTEQALAQSQSNNVTNENLETIRLREEQVEKVKSEILAYDNIKSCTYISKEEGLDNTKSMLGEDGYLLDGLQDRNYIPDTFIVTLIDLERTNETFKFIEKLDGVDLVIASTEVSDTLIMVQKTVNTLGSLMILALAIISLVIISNTIKSTIHARRKEINIMKYVGATNTFIRIPFVVEGFLLGLIAAGIAYFLVWGGYNYLIQAFSMNSSVWLNSIFESIIPFESVAENLAIAFGATGTILGSVGSIISIKNHIKV